MSYKFLGLLKYEKTIKAQKYIRAKRLPADENKTYHYIKKCKK